jgi:hypothetical protein
VGPGGVRQGEDAGNLDAEAAGREMAVDGPGGVGQLGGARPADDEAHHRQVVGVERPQRCERLWLPAGGDDDGPAGPHERRDDVELGVARRVPPHVDALGSTRPHPVGKIRGPVVEHRGGAEPPTTIVVDRPGGGDHGGPGLRRQSGGAGTDAPGRPADEDDVAGPDPGPAVEAEERCRRRVERRHRHDGVHTGRQPVEPPTGTTANSAPAPCRPPWPRLLHHTRSPAGKTPAASEATTVPTRSRPTTNGKGIAVAHRPDRT